METEILLPKELWRWREMCESGNCLYKKDNSGYCWKHKRRKLWWRKAVNRLLGVKKKSPKTEEGPSVRPRSPQELGLYD